MATAAPLTTQKTSCSAVVVKALERPIEAVQSVAMKRAITAVAQSIQVSRQAIEELVTVSEACRSGSALQSLFRLEL